MLKVLIVEDNEILSNNIAKYLELEGIDSIQLFNGKRVSYEIVSNHYDLVILDLGLGKIDGLDVCKKIRDLGKNIPILILTARNTLNDKKRGFNNGADDYLTKPFEYEELILRINALIRRNYTVKSNNITLGNIEINIDTKNIKNNGEEIHLSQLEFDLLVYLIHNKSKIISKQKLLENVWGEYDNFTMSRTVDVYIGYLRKKLGKEIIKTVRGQGYIIN